METNGKTDSDKSVARYINHIKENKERILILFAIYIFIIFLACILGAVLSLVAQRGGITQQNAFIAPLLGPWSLILPPNSKEVRHWSIRYEIFAKSLTLVLVLCLAGSILIKNFWLSYMSTVITFFALVIWVICGLGKVLLELS